MFNDDKKTDLIGEAWVDLNSVIIPGGGQGDHWHALQYRGKYAGDIRIEMTYYDARPRDDAAMDRRREAIQKIPSKANMSPTSSLSGSRNSKHQKDVKRRPLPSDPLSARNFPSISVHDFALSPPDNTPEHAPTLPIPAGDGISYDPSGARVYETPDDIPRGWEPMDTLPHHHHGEDFQHSPECYPQDDPYFRQPGYDEALQSSLPSRLESIASAPAPVLVAPPLNAQPPDSIHQTTTMPSDRHQYLPNDGFMQGDRSRQNSVTHEDYHHWEYATMQPTVQDEEEEGARFVVEEEEEEEFEAPPPPPLHRSAMRKSHTYPVYHREHNHDVVTPQWTGVNGPPYYVDESRLVIPEADTVQTSARHSGIEEEPGQLSLPVSVPAPLSLPALSGPAPPTAPKQNALTSSPSTASTKQQRPGFSRAGSGIRTVPTRECVFVSPNPPPPPPPRDGIGMMPFSPDSYNALNPQFVTWGTRDDDDSSKQPHSRSAKEVPPVIGDDGQEIDPSDHLPFDTWAPEPEKKPRKPEVIVRFKHPSPKNAGQPTAAPPRNTAAGRQPPTTHVHITNEPSAAQRNRDAYYGYGVYVPTRPVNARGIGSSSNSNPVLPTVSRGSTSSASPLRSSPSTSRGSVVTSSLYEPVCPGPPIPVKVPVQSYPVMAVNRSMDALSRELNSIDIGSCSRSNGGRRYVPRTMSTGYAA